MAEDLGDSDDAFPVANHDGVGCVALGARGGIAEAADGRAGLGGDLPLLVEAQWVVSWPLWRVRTGAGVSKAGAGTAVQPSWWAGG